MNRFDRLETLAQQLIEGAFHRLFQPPPVKPADNGRIDTKETAAEKPPNLAACWLLRYGERQLRLGEPVVRIGRALDNDLILSEPTVSRYHAQLRWRDGRYHLCPPALPVKGERWENMASTQNLGPGDPQTRVNHGPVVQKALASGDVIELGEACLTVIVEPAAD